MRIAIVCAALAWCALWPRADAEESAPAPSYDELVRIVRDLQSQLATQGQQIRAHEHEIQGLRAQLGRPPTPTVVDLVPEGIEAPLDGAAASKERVDVQSREKGLQYLRLGGRAEIEWVKTQNEQDSRAGATANPDPHFQIDTLALKLDARVNRHLHAYAKVDVGSDNRTEFDDLFIELDNLPLDGQISAGQLRRFIEMDRRTESYPLLGNAFWRGRQVGLRGEFSLGDFTVHGSLGNGLRLRQRGVGEDAAFPTLLDGTRKLETGRSTELAIGLEHKLELSEDSDLELMAFASFGSLDDADLELLTSVAASGMPSTNDDRSFYGFNLVYDWHGFELQGQFIDANEGDDLDRIGWTVQPSWKIDLPGIEAGGSRWLTAIRPLFRYGTLRNDFEARANDSSTWNRTAYTAAAILNVAPHTELYFEQTWNREEPGRYGIRNDEFLIHLRLSW